MTVQAEFGRSIHSPEADVLMVVQGWKADFIA
jgi:hypothetical protein